MGRLSTPAARAGAWCEWVQRELGGWQSALTWMICMGANNDPAECTSVMAHMMMVHGLLCRGRAL